MPTADQFIGAFSAQWNVEMENPDNIRPIYPAKRLWTKFMLGKKGPCQDSFLYRVSDRLNLQMAREWYTLDCVYYEEGSDVYGDGGYPACLQVLIEHENGEDVETEMYKLLMFRSPLKVLIFYDYDEDRKTTDGRRIWLHEKLETLLDMGQQVDGHWPEADNTEYLFLVGNREDENQLPRWRYLIVNGGNFGNVGEPLPLVFL